MAFAEYRDAEGRTFAEHVADRVMAAISERGLSRRQAADLAGMNRTTFNERINNVRPFTTAELGRIAAALDVHPAMLVEGFVPII